MERGRIRKGQKREGTVMEMYAHEKKGNINEHTIFYGPSIIVHLKGRD